MPRARRRPVLSVPLSPASEAALQAFAGEVRARGQAARERRLAAAGDAGADGADKGLSEGDAGAKAARDRKRVSRTVRGRKAGLEAQIARLMGAREGHLAAGAYEAVITVDRQLAELRLRLRNAEAREALRAEKLARRGRGQTHDRFALLVERSARTDGRLGAVHLEIADALRDAVLMAGMAGGVPGAVSGQAGDGHGNMRFSWSPERGIVELGEDFWGSLGIGGGAATSGAAGGRRTIKRVCRASDGGMARAADAVKRARGLAREFAAACAAAAGGEAWPAAVAVRVILLNQGLERACEAEARMRISAACKVAESAMAAGLEAVAERVGVAV